MTAGRAREDKPARARERWRLFISKPVTARPIWLRYGVAVGVVVLATLACKALAPHSYRTPFLLFYPSVVFAVWFGGLGPGVLATVLASLAANYYALPPYNSFNQDLPSVLQTAFFALTFISVCWFVDLARQQLYSVIDVQSQRLRAIFDHAGVGILERDAEDRIIAANDRAMEVLGRSGENLIGKTMRELTAPEDRERTAELSRDLRSGRRDHFVCENRFRKPDGSLLWSHVTVSAIHDSKGHLLRSIATLEDITERRLAEEALIRSEKLASVGRMAATIAHEINNPLAAVMNSLFIASSLDISSTAREYLEIADSELKRIAHLTKQALGFYRETSNPELVDLAAVVDSAVDLLKSKIKLKQVYVQKEYAAAAPIMAVTGELRQVFANLFANSLDAIEPRGKIRIRVSACSHARNGNQSVRITIADNGRGIPPEVLPHIFEPLYTTKASVGTGLGLWVGRQLVEKHGGCIKVHSRVGGPYRGSVFSVLLPAEGMPTEKSAAAPLTS